MYLFICIYKINKYTHILYTICTSTVDLAGRASPSPASLRREVRGENSPPRAAAGFSNDSPPLGTVPSSVRYRYKYKLQVAIKKETVIWACLCVRGYACTCTRVCRRICLYIHTYIHITKF